MAGDARAYNVEVGAQNVPYLTPEEYLEIERNAPYQSEYYRGEMYPVTGGTDRHSTIIGNLAGELRHALRNTPCVVHPTALRVRVSLDGLYAYPDIQVICAAPRFIDGHRDMVDNPVLIIEVLSPSTEGHDRGLKFAQYRTLESLREYVLVSQNEPRVERFSRQAANEWLFHEFLGIGEQVIFDSVECRIPMAEIYLKVQFPE